MNDPPSDGNESIIDIFVLSVNETVVPLFTEHLEKKGYRVTLFTDGTYLLETIRTGKPNLLICDTTTLDEEGFEVCRQIKADDDFWVIPVLILTSASTLTDLLHVLDCNADNFIPHPFDLSYSLSIIESMLGTPVERQTPDQIKTQFKISHDDRIYVVAANRRKLLEFLLSSFEIAVNKSVELSHIKTELQTLSESAIHLEDCVTDQTRVIDTTKATLQQKEQKISSLTHEVEEKKKLLVQKTDEIDQLEEKLDHHKALLTTYDANIRTLIQEKKDTETSYCSELETLRQQISELSNEADTTKTSLDTVQGELDEEKIHCTSLECTLELLVQQKELAEKSLRSITDEHEHLKSAFEAEKNRAASSEQELRTALQAKTQSEQELALIITGLTETKQQQTADLTRLKGELEEESDQRISAENQAESLRLDKDQLASSISSLTGEYEHLKSAFEAEKNRAASSEQELRTALQAKTQSEQELALIITGLTETKQQQTADLTQLKGELEEESDQRISAENQAESLRLDKDQLASSLSSLTGEHEHLKSAFEAEKNRAASSEQELKAVMHTKTQSEQELALIITGLTETKQQQTADLTRLKGELEEESDQRISAENQAESLRLDKDQLASSLSSLTGEHEHLKSAFEAEKNRASSAEQELALIITGLNETKQQQTADLTRLKGELEEESCQRISAENQVESLRLDKDQLESSLRSTITAHKEQLDELQVRFETTCAALRKEENTTQLLKENLAEIVAEKEKTIRTLTHEHEQLRSAFEAEKNRATSSEQELKAVMHTKTQSEQELALIITGLNETKQQQTADLTRLKGELEEESCQRISAENQVESLRLDKEQLESSLRSTITALKEQLNELQVRFETTCAALQNEENTTQLLKENLDEVVAEKEKTEVRVKEDLESYKTTFIRLKRDLDEATAIPKTLERDLYAAKIQNKALADELNLANQSSAQSVQQVHSLEDELEKMKAALDAERSLHQTGDKSIEELMQTLQCLEQDLRSSVDEQDKLNKILENERRLRLIAEETSKAAAQGQEQLRQELCAVTDEKARQETDRALKIQNLEKEFELVCNLQKSLEEQVTILTKEKLQAEQNLKSLTDEIDQARIALADEWVEHMDSAESAAAVGREPPIRKQSYPLAEDAGIKKETGGEIIARESDLPVIVKSSSHALATVTTPDLQKSPVSEKELTSPEPSTGSPDVSMEAVTDVVKTFSDEDLFEEDEPVVPGADLTPKPADITESEPEKSSEEFSTEFPVSDSEKGEASYPDDGQTDEDIDEEPEKGSTGIISDESGRPFSPVMFSFNRKQWFDLLKWAHHSTTLSHDQRLQIVRMGRLIQKDRKLTRKQEDQVKEMIALVQALGYRPS